MTRASYNTDNTLTELPGMMRPEDWHYWDDEEYKEKLAEYTAHVATLRTLVCSPECRGLFEAGKVYEEGKDYEVRPVCIHTGGFEHADCVHPSCDKCAMTAFPFPVKSEDDLWLEVIHYLNNNSSFSNDTKIEGLKQSFSLTKKIVSYAMD